MALAKLNHSGHCVFVFCEFMAVAFFRSLVANSTNSLELD